jgi:hypothetical protein
MTADELDILGPDKAIDIFASHPYYRTINRHGLNNLVPLQEIMFVNKGAMINTCG